MAEKAKKVEFFWGNVNLGGKLLYTESSENLTSCISKDSYFNVFPILSLSFSYFFITCVLLFQITRLFFLIIISYLFV